MFGCWSYLKVYYPNMFGCWSYLKVYYPNMFGCSSYLKVYYPNMFGECLNLDFHDFRINRIFWGIVGDCLDFDFIFLGII